MKKFTSRKFLTAVAGLITGIGLIIAGDVTEGAVMVITSITTYLVAEGIIDARSVGMVTDTVTEIADEIGKIGFERGEE